MAELINRDDTLNQGRVKLNESIKQSERAENKADEALDTANEAKERSELTQTQLDTVVIEGDSSVEAAQARVDEEGVSHTTLKDRIDYGFDKVNTQITRTKNDVFHSSMINHKKPKAQMTIIDDDAFPAVYTKLKHIVEEEDVPISLAVVTDRVDVDSRSVTLDQLKELEEVGFEIVSHTSTHPHLDELTDEELEYELGQSAKWLNDNGFDGNLAIVYPFGAINESVLKVARKYYDCGFDIDHGDHLLYNHPPIDTFKIRRVQYNWMNGFNDVQTCKDKIDEAINTGGWLVLMVHCYYDGFDENGLREVINYAKTQGVDIVNIRDGLNNYGNLIDYDTNYGPVRLGANGEGNIKDYTFTTNIAHSVTFDTPLNKYPKGTSITHFYQNHPNIAGFPDVAGILETYNGSDNYNYQIFTAFYDVNRGNRYRRYWLSGQWTDFERMDGQGSSIELDLETGVSGTVECSRTNDGLVWLRGRINVESPINNIRIITTLPFGFGSGLYYPVFNVYNHSKNQPIPSVLRLNEARRLILHEDDLIEVGDSIRFTAIYQAVE